MKSAKALEGAARKAVRRGGLVLGSAFVISFAVNVLRLAGPMFMLLIYDRVLTSRSVETLVALFGLVLVLLAALGTLDYARKRMLARFGAQFQEQMEDTLLEHSSRHQLFRHNRAKPSLGLDEVDGLRSFFHSGTLISIFDFIWTPMFLAVVFVLHPTLGWVCVSGIGVIILLVLVQQAFVGGRRERAQAASGQITGLKNILIASRATVRSQNMGPGFKNRWKSARDTSRDNAIQLKDWTAWFTSMSKIVVMVIRYSVLATGAYLTLQGELTVGAMVAATFMVTRVLGPVDRFFGNLPNMFQARDQWRRLQQILLKRAAEMSDNYAEQAASPKRLILDNVSVRSPLTGNLILRSVSLSASAGEFIEITGASSQGKTVLAETILGMWSPSAGTILIDGRHASRLTDDEAGKLLGYVPEAPTFVAGTLEENIGGLDPDPNPDQVGLAARRARMHAAICALPDGYNTMIDAQASCLSTFERNQLALARAFYHSPRILIIDSLDAEMLIRIPRKLQATFSTLMKRDNVTIILLSRQSLDLPYTNRRYNLEDGRLTEVKSVSVKSQSQNVKVSSMGSAAVAGDQNKKAKISVVSDKSAPEVRTDKTVQR
ncbi:type I secretion system permease/ATPase [Falsiruegeria mediterranea]